MICLLSLNRLSYWSKPPLVLKKFLKGLQMFLTRIFWILKREKNTYALFKTKQAFLNHTCQKSCNTLIRNCVARSRLSNPKLMIEVDRHHVLQNREKGVNPYCPQCIKEEAHLLRSCPCVWISASSSKNSLFLHNKNPWLVQIIQRQQDRNTNV